MKAGTRPYAMSTRRISDESLWRQMEVEQETAGMALEMETAEGEEAMSSFDAARVAYEAGHRDALSTAVQRVEALIDPWPNTSPGLIRRSDAIAAIKGDQP